MNHSKRKVDAISCFVNQVNDISVSSCHILRSGSYFGHRQKNIVSSVIKAQIDERLIVVFRRLFPHVIVYVEREAMLLRESLIKS